MVPPLIKAGDRSCTTKWWRHYHIFIFRLDFSCSNNVAEDEALIISLVSALQMGIQGLRVQEDSKLVMVNEKFSLKERVLAFYWTGFLEYLVWACPLLYNKHANALATLASKAENRDDIAEIKVIRSTLRATTTKFMPEQDIDERDWQKSVIQNLLQPSSSTTAKEVKDFTIIEGELYYRGCGGILARAISDDEAKTELEHVHGLTFANNE